MERRQMRPVMWAKESAKEDFKGLKERWSGLAWRPVMEARYFEGADKAPNGISANIKRGDTQLAVWRVKGRYFTTQQMCPHKRTFVLSDGLIGEDSTGKESCVSPLLIFALIPFGALSAPSKYFASRTGCHVNSDHLSLNPLKSSLAESAAQWTGLVWSRSISTSAFSTVSAVLANCLNLAAISGTRSGRSIGLRTRRRRTSRG